MAKIYLQLTQICRRPGGVALISSVGSRGRMLRILMNLDLRGENSRAEDTMASS